MGERVVDTKEPSQSDKFKRTARDLGCDEGEAAFDRALEQMKKQAAQFI